MVVGSSNRFVDALIHEIFQLIALSIHGNRSATFVSPFGLAAFLDTGTNVVDGDIASTEESVEEIIHKLNSNSFENTSVRKLDWVCFLIGNYLISLTNIDFVFSSRFCVI